MKQSEQKKIQHFLSMQQGTCYLHDCEDDKITIYIFPYI